MPSKRQHLAEWDALVDRLFALDREYPYLGQMIDADAETGDEERELYEGQPREDDGRFGTGKESPEPTGHASEFAGLLKSISKPDAGFTYHAVSHRQPKTGYALSIYKSREQLHTAKSITPADLARYVRKNSDLLAKGDHYLGAWHNPKDDKVYLDVSRVVRTAQEAERLGRDHNQEAYFDLHRGKSVEISKRKHSDYGHQTSPVSHRPSGGQTDVGGYPGALPQTVRSGADAGGNRRSEGRAGEVSLGDWDESLHPREDDGKFTTAAGGGAPTAEPPPKPAPSKSDGTDSRKAPTESGASDDGRGTQTYESRLHDAEQSIRFEPMEHAVVLKADGTKVATLTNNARDYVILDKDEQGNTVDLANAVLTHNHPAGYGLSVDDGITAATRNLAEMRAVTKAHGTFSIKRQGATWPEDFKTRLEVADIQQRAEFTDEILKGTISVKDANDRHHDEVYKKVAKPGDVIYTHTPNTP